ncbi:hypothetical protein [Haloarchaeobius sp. HRN-SO-5]|uniref:hypothetical protein n=1 Tax=Haloarchaeobius sp. HRN-SO-5 TaxID=3446118 RepID=UPI003EB9C771
MGVRPPSNDTNEPSSLEFGIAAVDAHLDEYDVEYPATTTDLQRRLGHIDVPFDMNGNTLSLRDALSEAEPDEFEDEQALLNALHPVFERKRTGTRAGLVSRLRTLLPF